VRKRARQLGIAEDFHSKSDIHIHLPEGATPKDGPSAGIAIASALVSVLTGIPVRADVAMTGEITLRGEVLPIGGLKEKLLAAVRGGIQKALIPEENVKDLADLPPDIKDRIEIVPVRWFDKVLEHTLERRPEPLPDSTEVAAAPAIAEAEAEDGSGTGVVTH
jgi:ATP-dependent Lon protease